MEPAGFSDAAVKARATISRLRCRCYCWQGVMCGGKDDTVDERFGNIKTDITGRLWTKMVQQTKGNVVWEVSVAAILTPVLDIK